MSSCAVAPPVSLPPPVAAAAPAAAPVSAPSAPAVTAGGPTPDSTMTALIGVMTQLTTVLTQLVGILQAQAGATLAGGGAALTGAAPVSAGGGLPAAAGTDGTAGAAAAPSAIAASPAPRKPTPAPAANAAPVPVVADRKPSSPASPRPMVADMPGDPAAQSSKNRALIAKAQKHATTAGIGTKLSGQVSWYGGPNDHQDNNLPASGVPNTVPGIAVMNTKTLGGYWRVTAPNGRTLVLQQTDVGPGKSTGKVVDVNYTAVKSFGYTEGNFPTGGHVTAVYLGPNP